VQSFATQLRDQIVELFQALVVDGERAALSVEGDLGLEAELGGEVAFQSASFSRGSFTVLKRFAFCCARRSASRTDRGRRLTLADNRLAVGAPGHRGKW
jgi:hypothetical protein